MQHLIKNGNIVGVKMDSGMSVIRDFGKGIIIEFSKKNFQKEIEQQIADPKRTYIGFGLDDYEAQCLRLAIDGAMIIEEKK